jgi:hypothetical protein
VLLLNLLVMRMSLMGVVRLMMRPELAERIEALRAGVLNILDMRPVHALFGMTFGVGIVDIRIVALLLFVALLKARHAWIPPQRAALAGRRGQSYYVLDHCWVALCFQKARGVCVAWLFLAMRLCAFRNLGI